jgi:serine/threonine protein kinase
MEQKGSDTVCPACGYKEGAEPDSPLHLRPRTELHGQYLVGKVLGHGGFGITYLGWDLNLERKIAIKEYLPSGVAVRTGLNSEVIPFSGETRKDFEYGLERYLDEARTVARFQMHPSVVSVLNFFRANGTAYLVMEYLEGATFERYLESNGGKTNIDTAMTVMIPVVEALASVHSQGILHRDISPDNVYITRKWQVKVLDFGAARYALGQKSRNLSVILKEGYAPVEQYHSKGNQGPWTDAYACAATMYRALTGKIPPSSLDRMQADDLEAPSTLGVEISEVQERAILKALSVHPDKRFKTMQEFKDALTGATPADVIDQTGEKIKSATPAPLPAGPVVTGPKQANTVKSGTPDPLPAPSSERVSQREAPHSRRQEPAKMPKWVWAAAAGMLLAVVGIGGYKSYQDHLRELAIKQQQERTRILQEEEDKRQKALAVEMERRKVERDAENERLRRQQEELDQKNRELEQKERELQDLRNRNARVPSNNQSKSQQQQQQQQQNYYAQLLETQRKEREKLEEERRQLAERYRQSRFNTGNRNQQSQNQQQNGLVPTPPPETPVITPSGPSYESLMQSAANLSRGRNYQSALQMNHQAIQMNPGRPDAYSNIGWISLYATGDLQAALSNYKEAIARGGTAWFRVLHDHQQLTYQDHCQGDFGISKEGVTFRAQNGIHNFTVGKSAIREIKENKATLNFMRKVKDDFHVKTSDDRNFNLLPVSNARQVRDMIIQLAK